MGQVPDNMHPVSPPFHLYAGDAKEKPLFQAARADKVAELALACVLQLLQQTRPLPGEHTLSMLQRAAAVAELAPSAATEEVCPLLIWKARGLSHDALACVPSVAKPSESLDSMALIGQTLPASLAG